MLTLNAGSLAPALAAALLAVALVRLWAGKDREPRRWVAPALWLAAAGVIALNAATFVVNDDEVFYLADSYAQWQGETNGYLPLRYLLLRPLVLLPFRPSTMVVLARALVVALTVGCGWAAARLARALGAAAGVAAAAGAVTALWLGTSVEMVFLRPEYIAAALVSGGLVLLVAPPARLSARAALAGGFALLALAGGVSPRQALLLPFVGAALARDRRGLALRPALAWSMAGTVAGLLPTLGYVLAFDEPRALWYFNVVLPSEDGQLSGWPSARFPLPLFALGAAALVAMGLSEREVRPGEVTVGALWIGSSLLPVLMPHWLLYAHGPWVVASVVLGAVLWGRIAPRASAQVWRAALVLFALAALAPLLHPAGLRRPRDSGMGSQLGLIDWLAEVSAGSSAACVSPYHPIRVRNAWRLWNAWWYCYRQDPDRLRAMPVDGIALPRDGRAGVIQWDAWPEKSGQANVVAWAMARGLLAPSDAEGVVRALVRDYRLVRWRRPLPGPYGGGRFLVHRALPIDERVEVLADAQVLRAAP